MIILSNSDAIEMLESITNPELGCNVGTEEQYAEMCELLVMLQQEDNTMQLMITPVADQDPDLGNMIVCPTGDCPLPAISLPIVEQLG